MISARILLCAALLLACAKDRTITRGADGNHDWQRLLENAIPVGARADSATRILTANGFKCGALDSTSSSISCDKNSEGRFELVRRKWHAGLHVRAERVDSVKASTGLIGP